MAQKYKDTPYFILERRYRGRRLQRVTQCTTQECLDHYHDTLKGLAKTDAGFKFIEAIFAQTMTIDQVVALQDEGKRSTAVAYDKVIRLFHQRSKAGKGGKWKEDGDVYHWLDTTKYPKSEDTRKRYRRSFRNLSKLRRVAKLHELAGLLKHYRQVCERRDIPVEFNHTRAACLSYVSKRHGGKHSPIWNAISGIPKIEHEVQRDPRYVIPETAWKLASHLPDKVRPAFWMVLLTGMRPMSEFKNRKWSVAKNHIHIARSKTKSSKRVVPLVLLPGVLETFPTKRPCSHDYFSRCLAKLGYTVLDLRNSYAKFLETLQIPHSFAQFYSGHKTPRDMTTYYQRVIAGDTTTDIEAHGELISNYILDGRRGRGAFRPGQVVTEILKPEEMPEEERDAYGEDLDEIPLDAETIRRLKEQHRKKLGD